MSQQYYTLVTNIGAARIAKATALGTVVNLSQMAVGDGGGNPITPSATATALTREVYRASLNMLEVDENNQKQVIAELLIPEEEGDFTIREVGLFDNNNNLIAIGSIADSYKPRLSSGTASQQIIRMVIQIDNTDAVGLKVDPAVVLATREFVEQTVNKKFGNVAYRVPSIAALREFNKPGASVVIVENYHEGINGGGGVFVKSDNQALTDNAATVIVGESGTRWRRQYTTLTIRDFGFADSKNNAVETIEAVENININNLDPIDCLGETITISDGKELKKKYKNGKFIVGGKKVNANYNLVRTGWGRVIAGDEAAANIKTKESTETNIIAIGNHTMANTKQVSNVIAIGANAMGNSEVIRDNIAIGEMALLNVNAKTSNYDQNKMEGTRNIAIGTNSLISLKSGQGNIAIGRNSGQSAENTNDNIFIGRNAFGGTAPFSLNNRIKNVFPSVSSGNVVIGANAAMTHISTDSITAIGNMAANKVKTAKRIVAVGAEALKNIDSEIGINGGNVIWEGIETGTYNKTGVELNININNTHGAAIGDVIGIRLLNGNIQTLQNDIIPVVVNEVSGNNIKFIVEGESDGEGTAEIKYILSAGTSEKTTDLVTAVGRGALKQAKILNGVDAFGAEAMIDVTTAQKTVAVGSYSLKEGEHVSTVAVGYWTAPRISTESCVFIGDSAGYRWQNNEIARGKIKNSIAIGALARVSGDNEIQIGVGGQTLYAPTGVNIRSDERDKADLKPLKIGLEFVKKLKPTRGVYDRREKYIDEIFTDLPFEERTKKIKEWWVNPIKDGRHKEKNEKFWFNAQELKKLEKEFGRLPMLNFRDETYSIEYELFIPVLAKAIQELAAKVEKLENENKELKDDKMRN